MKKRKIKRYIQYLNWRAEVNQKVANMLFYGSVKVEERPGFLGGALPGAGGLKPEATFQGLGARYMVVKKGA